MEQIDAVLQGISVNPCEELKCPRIGIDPEATQWFRRELWETHRAQQPHLPFWDLPFEEALRSYHGRYVPALAKVREGLSEYVGPVGGETSVRAKVLQRALDALQDRDLISEGWRDHDAQEAGEYADRLQGALQAHRGQARPESVEIVEAAARWLRFWSGRGYGFRAWF